MKNLAAGRSAQGWATLLGTALYYLFVAGSCTTWSGSTACLSAFIVGLLVHSLGRIYLRLVGLLVH